MALTDMLIRGAKQREKQYKMADEKGLYLLITQKGTKLWRYKYTYHGREKKLSFGAYPTITLKDARRMRDDARRKIIDGMDPAQQKRAAKIAAKLGAEIRFEAIAEEFLAKREKEGLLEATLLKKGGFFPY